jgi:hypothetical protein
MQPLILAKFSEPQFGHNGGGHRNRTCEAFGPGVFKTLSSTNRTPSMAEDSGFEPELLLRRLGASSAIRYLIPSVFHKFGVRRSRTSGVYRLGSQIYSLLQSPLCYRAEIGGCGIRTRVSHLERVVYWPL